MDHKISEILSEIFEVTPEVLLSFCSERNSVESTTAFAIVFQSPINED